VIALDGKTGGQLWRTQIAETAYSTQRGIAYTGSLIWLDEMFDGKYFLVDLDGNLVGTASAPELGQQSYLNQLQLSWDAGQLVVVFDNQITWFALKPA
jgi:hypothetical protein